MNRAVLLFVFLLMFSACDKEIPIPSSSEGTQQTKESLLHPLAGPVPISDQVSQTDDSSSPNSFSFLSPDRTSPLVQSSTPPVSPPSVLTEEAGGVIRIKHRKNEAIVTELASLDKESSPLPSDDILQTGGGVENASAAKPPSHWKSIPQLTFEQVFHSEFVTNRMGGSDRYRQYMADTLVYIHNTLLRTSEDAREEFAFLCDDPFCSKGLKNVDSLSANDMARMLYMLGKREKIWHIAPLKTIVLQGIVTGESEFEQLARTLNQIINAHEIDSLWINLSHPWDHLPFMFELGKFILTNAVNLRVIGRCSDACANYLIPATYQVSQVFMEPGGNIFFGGGYVELYREMRDSFQDNRIALKRRFEETYFSQGDRKGVKDRLSNADNSATPFMLRGPLALNGLNHFLSDRHKIAWEELSEDEKGDFLSSAPQKTVIEIKDRAFIQSDAYQSILRARRILARLKKLAQQEENYYKTLNTPSGELYAYSDLIRLTTALVKQPVYEEYFIVNRRTTLGPEKNIPYKAVVPSMDILKQSGINIQGEHHREVMESIYGEPESFLMLDQEDMQKYL